MRKYSFLLVVILFLLLFMNKGLAQNQQKIDSLKQLLTNTSSDSVKLHIYSKLTNIYRRSRTQTKLARNYADSILILSEKLKIPAWSASGHYYLSLVDNYQGNYQGAINHMNNYVEYYEELKDSIRLTKAFFAIGKAYKKMNDYDKSLHYLYKSALISEEINDSIGIAKSYNSIASVNNSLKKYDNAITFYNKANTLFNQLKNKKSYAMGIQNLGNVYGNMRAYDKAIKQYKRALGLIEQLNLDYEKSIILGNLGDVYTLLKKHELALDYQLKAFKIKKTLSNKLTQAHALLGLSTSYVKLLKYKKAEKTIEEGLILATEIGAKRIISSFFGLKSLIGLKQKDYKKAFENIELSNQWKDSVFNDNTSKQITELELKYQTAQKDKEIQLLTKENQLQEAKSQKETDLRKALIAGLFLLTIIGGLLFYSMRQRLRNQKMLVEKNEEIKRSQYREQLQVLEMKALRAQMNPHFLFNSLNSINTMILSDENDSASKYLSKFSKLVRLMLENSERPKVSLKDEINMLETYVQLETLRFNNKIEYKIEVNKTIDQDDTYLPSMVLQPFVENAIWHGLLHNDKKGLLTIIIKEDSENLYCSIIDNGIGREKSLTLQKEGGLKKKSMGIKITTERLRLLTQQKINEVIAIIDLKDENNNAIGTQVNIQIPLS